MAAHMRPIGPRPANAGVFCLPGHVTVGRTMPRMKPAHRDMVRETLGRMNPVTNAIR